jgi:hypothetical protein
MSALLANKNAMNMKVKASLLVWILITGIGSLLPYRSAGQSVFYFTNWLPGGGLDSPVFDGAGNRLFGSDYVAMLYGGPTPDSLQPAWDSVYFHDMPPVPFTFAPEDQAGYFRDTGYVQIGNVACGATPWLQVRAWDTRLGGAYEDVVALGIGGYGESDLFQHRGGDCDAGPPEPLFGLESFSLLPVVPEPSCSVLLLLGLPWLIWRSRHPL